MAVNVWDFPRPPRLEPEPRLVRIDFGGGTVACSDRALRVLETSHPPTVYVPREHWLPEALRPSRASSTLCEWKGRASPLDLAGADGRVEEAVGWTYPDPVPAFAALRGHVAVYPGRMDGCWLGEERVRAQDGDFYGGWITAELVGPFKGAPGTLGW